MRTATVAFILACLISVLLTPILRRFALRRGLFDDNASERKIHGRAIPRLGGIAIAVAFYVPLLALLVERSGVGHHFYANSRMALAFLLGGLAICGLGLYDDLRGAGAPTKFLVQFGVAGALYYAGFRIEVMSLPFASAVQLGPLSMVVTLLWIVGVINAMNLIDGLDGLAAGVGLFGVTTTFVLAALHGDPIMMLFMAALGGALLGFLVYNFNPASIFMGDAGSMFIGYVLAVGAVQTNQKSSTAVAILVPIVALGVPIADTVLAIIRRIIRHRPLFSADRAHIHHKLLDLGLSQRQAVLVLYAVSGVLGGVALLLTMTSSLQTAMVLLAIGTLGFLGLRRISSDRLLRSAGASRDMDTRRQIDRLALASDEDRLWGELKGVAQCLGWQAIRLSLLREDESGDLVSIQRTHGDWGEQAGPVHTLNAVARTARVGVEIRAQLETHAAVFESVRQAFSSACVRTFGNEPESRIARTDIAPPRISD
jgi:UDP-GlcNAc:undecaprenyl-phosphate GlcNAc-1-phosphate transferase